MSLLNFRALLAKLAGQTFGGKRDYYDTLEYPENLSYRDYYKMYARHDIATAVIEKPVKWTWKNKPSISEIDTKDNETEFEKDLAKILKNEEIMFFNKIKRADILSRVGRYSVIFIGVADGEEVGNDINTSAISSSEDIMYLSVFSEGSAKIKELENDPKNKRFGKPKKYEIDFSNSELFKDFSMGKTKKVQVHHSRIIHLSEGLLENEVLGTPALKCIYNQLINLLKVVGAGAEGYWKNVDGWLHGNVKDDYDITGQKDEIEEQMLEAVNGLRKHLITQGMDFKSLNIDVKDPKGFFDVIVTLISAATGIPKRILLGSERGELASSQDETSFINDINDRQTNYIIPFVLRQIINRFIEIGVVSEPKNDYEIEFEELFELDDKEKSEIAKNYGQAVKSYSNGNSELVIPIAEFREKFLGLSAEIPKEYLVEENLIPEDDTQAQNYFKKLVDSARETRG